MSEEQLKEGTPRREVLVVRNCLLGCGIAWAKGRQAGMLGVARGQIPARDQHFGAGGVSSLLPDGHF